jgi:photosystem II stability/assembly factor-like uncharacterized protein
VTYLCRLALSVMICLIAVGWLAATRVDAQQVDPSTFSGLRWRLIGPFRAGRALAAAGVSGQPNVFYFGAVGGGVWKTMNAGRTWTPIFDDQPVASIGALAVAPSDPNVIYVGSGEADMRSQISYGNGMYKSTNAGKTWSRIGLDDTRQIGRILVDPRDANLVYVAALGHAYGPNDERGVFRSTDGGQTWRRILFKDADTGAIDLAFDPRDSRTIYAAMWQTRRPPWSIYAPSNGPGSGLYKSTDGGDTWMQITGHGLPSEGLGRMGIAVAPTNPSRIYLVVDAKEGGLYRSDDSGANWHREANEARIWGRGWYFCGVTVDPKDADTVYVMNTSTYRSRDAGKTFTAIKGAPGGDDYHSLWIDPNDSNRMIMASDQGVIVSLDGAETWSSWYNQPTAQFYHVAADYRFPYWVWGAQQDSGSAGTTTQSAHRNISFRDWDSSDVGGESGYIAPDPLHPNIVYGGTVTRLDLNTGQHQNVSPSIAHPGTYRRAWTLPLVFSERDPHELYVSFQILFRTTNGGQSWQVMSPGLTREDPGVPPNLDPATAADAPAGKRRGVIYTVAPSPLRAGEIWIGTDDGYIQVTRDDGKTWHNVTPPELTAWSKVSMMVVSRHDADTVYASVDRHRLEDYKPYVYRTKDGGKTWKNVANGIPEGHYVNAVREDSVRKGLLYVGTEMGVYVSFDDGDHWQPLQMNLPNASVRDLAIRDDDLIVATHGRSFWVLDDISPLREASEKVAQSNAYLFKPRAAWRTRAGSDNGTPLPTDEAAAENPPLGASLNYFLKSAPKQPVTIEILDAAGKTIRRYSSEDPVQRVNPATLDIPAFWVRPAAPLSAEPGMHRWTWDLHYASRAPAGGGGRGTGGGRGGGGAGPWPLPGKYAVRLSVDGTAYTQPLTLKMDPRVKTPLADLVKQFELSTRIADAQAEALAAIAEAGRLRQQVTAMRGAAKAMPLNLTQSLAALDKKLEALIGPAPTVPGGGGEPAATERTSLRYVSGTLGGGAGGGFGGASLMAAVQSADVAPTLDIVTAFNSTLATLHMAEAALEALKTKDVSQVNELLKQIGLPVITAEQSKPAAGGARPVSGGSKAQAKSPAKKP